MDEHWAVVEVSGNRIIGFHVFHGRDAAIVLFREIAKETTGQTPNQIENAIAQDPTEIEEGDLLITLVKA